MNINALFDRLEAQENSLAGTRVLAPVLANRAVTVKIAGVLCSLKVEAKNRAGARGWGVLEVVSNRSAKWLREATKLEIEKYLALLPAVRFIALERDKNLWIGWPAHSGDSRFQASGAVLIRGNDANIQPFDTLIARFDGTHFWLEKLDSRRSPAISNYLRESFAAGIEPEKLAKKGLSSEERAAYAFALYGPPPEPEIEFPTATVAGETISTDWRHYRDQAAGNRIARAVSHGGGQLVSTIERDGVTTVTYRFGDRTHTSTVRSDDLTVVTSGICLSGRDNDFDLTSLVGVMQEAARIEPWQFGDDYNY